MHTLLNSSNNLYYVIIVILYYIHTFVRIDLSETRLTGRVGSIVSVWVNSHFVRSII